MSTKWWMKFIPIFVTRENKVCDVEQQQISTKVYNAAWKISLQLNENFVFTFFSWAERALYTVSI